jgi:hypothetical protein
VHRIVYRAMLPLTSSLQDASRSRYCRVMALMSTSTSSLCRLSSLMYESSFCFSSPRSSATSASLLERICAVGGKGKKDGGGGGMKRGQSYVNSVRKKDTLRDDMRSALMRR